jgi:hypothetical protein
MTFSSSCRRPAHIISVCAMKDARTWMFTSPEIRRRIAGDNYHVIVPDNEVSLFREISDSAFTIIRETEFFDGLSIDYVRQRMPDYNKERSGWYYQQLLKIQALLRLPADGDDVLVIWDADTLPLVDIDFIEPDGKLRYFRGTEHYLPYFETIDRLIRMKKIVDFSFIAQCFPIRRRWIIELVETIESRSGKPWYDTILDSIDFREECGFSEYETMGTFITYKYLSEITICNLPWERHGGRKYDLAALHDWDCVAGGVCFVSFESWDRPGPPL